jgi:hypothetical protein
MTLETFSKILSSSDGGMFHSFGESEQCGGCPFDIEMFALSGPALRIAYRYLSPTHSQAVPHSRPHNHLIIPRATTSSNTSHD